MDVLVQKETDEHGQARIELASAHECIDALEADNAALQSEVEDAKTSAMAERDAYEAAAQDLDSRRKETEAAFAEELHSVRTRCTSLEHEKVQLLDEVARCTAAIQDLQARQQSALMRVGASRRQDRAAIVIQRSWRRWQRREAQAAAARDAQGWCAERNVLTQQQQLAAAQTGRTLMMATVQQVEATVQTLLLEMLLSGPVKRKLKAAQSAAGVPHRGQHCSVVPSLAGDTASAALSAPTSSVQPLSATNGKRPASRRA